jgi:hypothetical protein
LARSTPRISAPARGVTFSTWIEAYVMTAS